VLKSVENCVFKTFVLDSHSKKTSDFLEGHILHIFSLYCNKKIYNFPVDKTLYLCYNGYEK